ncbi:MAG: hypothetical protein KAU01_11505 [Candidatus Cloacimonetes bacterium]|nr:hypothetical protein [Candidatus Cloacimonadota bacterium]
MKKVTIVIIMILVAYTINMNAKLFKKNTITISDFRKFPNEFLELFSIERYFFDEIFDSNKISEKLTSNFKRRALKKIFEEHEIIKDKITKKGNWSWFSFDNKIHVEIHNNTHYRIYAILFHVTNLDKDYLLSYQKKNYGDKCLSPNSDGVFEVNINLSAFSKMKEKKATGRIKAIVWAMD